MKRLTITDIKPALDSATTPAPTAYAVTNVKPPLYSIGGGMPATYTTTTYNDPTVTYSSATQVYGGSDRQRNTSPQLHNTKNIRPALHIAYMI